MVLGAKIFDLLTTAPGVSALVGTNVFPNYVPKDSNPPAIVYFVLSALPTRSLTGTGVGLVDSQVQIDAWGTTYLEAHAIAKEIIAALDHYTEPGFRFEEDRRRDLFDPETGYHRVSMQFNAWHEEE